MPPEFLGEPRPERGEALGLQGGLRLACAVARSMVSMVMEEIRGSLTRRPPGAGTGAKTNVRLAVALLYPSHSINFMSVADF